MKSHKVEKKELLRPVNTGFIVFTMIVAIALNFIPLGKAIWRPDILAVVSIYWATHQPKKISLTFVFFLGLVMDVHYGAWLGQHSLVYVLGCFIGIAGSRRILWFDLWGQMWHVFPIFVIMQFLLIFIYWMQGAVGINAQVLIAPLLEILLWPVADFLLLRPQRGSPEKQGI